MLAARSWWCRAGTVGAAALVGGGLAAQHDLATAARTFAPCDVDGDGVVEVAHVDVLCEAGAATAPGAVVLVEPRVLAADPADAAGRAAAAALRERLSTYATDLAADGLHALVLAVDVHQGPPHQDGRTLLGLRRLLAACHAAAPLAGATLVGHFPDALLVRTCNWRRREALELPGPDGKAVAIAAGTTNVRCVPEYVAHRCDTVLADLDGEWETVYVPGPAVLPSVTAVFGDPVPDAGGPCLARRTDELHVVDVFHVRDGAAVPAGDAFAVALDPDDRDHECSAADRALGNPLAQPEIAVSRIDARGIARLPEARALDAHGQPCAVELADGDDARGVHWHHDLAFERRLLLEYFDHNHAFRTRRVPAAERKPASICWGLGSGMAVLRAADAAWRDFAEAGYDECEHVDLPALARWLQRPAILRTLRAHSDGHFAQFAGGGADTLAAVLGGPAWQWHRDGQRLVPSLAANGHADFCFYRTLWQNHAVSDVPYLLLHTGCEALSPPGCVRHAFDDDAYDSYQHAEAILFFTPCVALVGRAKVFYDEPRGFSEVLANGGTFGEAWRRYFAVEGTAANWDEAGGDIGRKRAYFWSMLGDWSLRLPKG